MGSKTGLTARYSTGSSEELQVVEEVDPTRLIPVTTLGRGSYGKVVLAKVESDLDTRDDGLVAVKIVAKSRLKSRGQIEKARTELLVMKTIAPSCPFLVHSRGSFQTDHCLVYVMPYSAGGELFFHLQREGCFNESRSRLIAMQIVLGLEQLHAHGVLYRDLKPENILISNDGRCQVADFGLSKFLPRASPGNEKRGFESSRNTNGDSTGERRQRSVFSKLLSIGKRKSVVEKASTSEEVVWGTTRTRCGTPAYQSVEIVLAKEHSLEADWWALGVLIYELLVGEPPFFADTVKEVYDVILMNNINYPKRIGDKAKNLISKLLVSDRTKRLGYGTRGIKNIKSSAFFTEPPPDSNKMEHPTWDQVARLATQPVVELSRFGTVGKPEDAIYFHADYTSMDVREYVTQPKNRFEIEGFQTVSQFDIGQFLSENPVSLVEKTSKPQRIETATLRKEIK